MMDLTFLIPTRIESEDRLRNIISSVSYLLTHVPAKVIVKEVSGRDTFKFRALPEIKKRANVENLTCLYEESNDPLFCKSKVLNDLIVAADTKVVANYDADCILPKSSYVQAYQGIADGEYAERVVMDWMERRKALGETLDETLDPKIVPTFEAHTRASKALVHAVNRAMNEDDLVFVVGREHLEASKWGHGDWNLSAFLQSL